jgi:hypothetical protein
VTQLLTARALLDAWERGLDEPAVVRPAVLAAAGLGRSVDEVLDWDIGRRDAALFELRVQLFGATADAVGLCPSCGAQLDVPLDLSLIGPGPTEPEPVTAGSYRVIYRLPTTADLLTLIEERDDGAARLALVRLAVLSIEDDAGRAVALECLVPGEQQIVASAIAAAQDGVDVRLALRCGACAYEWVAPFDIGAFLLREIDAWAEGILREVHALASAYGWSEDAILNLTARRRRAYLELVGPP